MPATSSYKRFKGWLKDNHYHVTSDNGKIYIHGISNNMAHELADEYHYAGYVKGIPDVTDDDTLYVQKRRNDRYEREAKHKKKLQRIYDCNHHIISPVYWAQTARYKGNGNVKYPDSDDPHAYLKRCYRGKCSKYFKRCAHKRTRREKYNVALKGNYSNRLYDYWWELF